MSKYRESEFYAPKEAARPEIDPMPQNEREVIAGFKAQALESPNARIAVALEVAERYGRTDESHHATWVIDQMVRALTGKYYSDWRAVNDTPDYPWSEGIAP